MIARIFLSLLTHLSFWSEAAFVSLVRNEGNVFLRKPSAVLCPDVSTQLFLAKRPTKKLSMAQKKKKRGKKMIPKVLSRPKVLDLVPKADEWDKVKSTEEQVVSMKEQEETKGQAAALVDKQRKSVEILTFIREKVDDLDYPDIIESLSSGSHFHVVDNFLGSELNDEMAKEGKSMLENNKLQLDISRGVCSGEFAAAITGGEEQYVDCPRCVEFVVSLTKQITTALNQKNGESEFQFKLNDGASMAGIRVFDRKARISSLSMLLGKDVTDIDDAYDSDLPEQPFSYVVNKDGEEKDMRKVSLLYFLNSDGWNEGCGASFISKEKDDDEVIVEAKHDRLILYRSDECLHKMDKWIGDSTSDFGACIACHFVD